MDRSACSPPSREVQRQTPTSAPWSARGIPAGSTGASYGHPSKPADAIATSPAASRLSMTVCSLAAASFTNATRSGATIASCPASARAHAGPGTRAPRRERPGGACYHLPLAEVRMAFFDLDPLLETMLDAAPGISDLNLSVGRPPQVEVDGQLRSVSFAGLEKLSPYHTELIAMRLLQGKRDLADKLVKTGSADLSYSLARRTRFRVSVFSQRGTYSIVLRVIPNKVPTVEELGLPPQLNQIAAERNGIVLFTGP